MDDTKSDIQLTTEQEMAAQRFRERTRQPWHGDCSLTLPMGYCVEQSVQGTDRCPAHQRRTDAC